MQSTCTTIVTNQPIVLAHDPQKVKRSVPGLFVFAILKVSTLRVSAWSFITSIYQLIPPSSHTQCNMSRILIYFLTICSALVQLATANFDLYKIWTWVPEGGRYGTTINDLWLITESHPDRCAHIDRYSIWASKEDLSHNRLGVRCWGSCNFGDVSGNCSLSNWSQFIATGIVTIADIISRTLGRTLNWLR